MANGNYLSPAGREHNPPPELLTLSHEGLRATIDPKGAHLVTLFDEQAGRDLLFPSQVIDGKRRGGSHVCLPIFGPGEAIGLNQHGFGHNLPWDVTYRDNDRAALELDIAGDEPEPGVNNYRGLQTMLHYEIGRDNDNPRLFMGLSISNMADKTMLVAPAFHPYFALQEGVSAEDIELIKPDTTRCYQKGDLSDAKFIRKPYAFRLGATEVNMLYRHFRIFAIWSDNPDRFVCVEPTVSASRSTDQSMRANLLEPRMTKDYSVSFVWTKPE